MTEVNKQIGLGTSLAVRSTTGSTDYTTVAGLIGISGPGVSGDKIDTSTIDNADNFKTFQVGQVDPGDMTLNLAYGSTNTSQKLLAGFLATRLLCDFKITYASTSIAAEECTAYVNGMGREIAKDGMVSRTLALAITGDPGWPKTTSTT